MTKKKNNVKILRGEKIVYFLIFFVIVSMPICTVFTKALLSESNIQVERMKAKIEDQNVTNESLSMQIDELASLDKVQEVASEKGLSYNNDNIKVITE